MDDIYWSLTIYDNNSYFKRFLELIKKTSDEDEKKLDARAKELEGKEEIFIEDYGWFDPADEIGNMAYEMEQMEQLMYKTFVVAVFIFMEAQITYVCERVMTSTKQNFSYKDLKGNGVSRSINYLQKVLGIRFPKKDEVKNEFDVAKIIRNALVHKEGEIENQYKSTINDYITKYPDLLNWDNSKIKITYEYAESLIELNKNICYEIQDYNKVKKDF